MTKTISQEAVATLRALVGDAISTEFVINTALVIKRLNELHPGHEIPSEILEARILSMAQQLNAPLSFKKSASV